MAKEIVATSHTIGNGAYYKNLPGFVRDAEKLYLSLAVVKEFFDVEIHGFTNEVK